jgi:ribonuclease P protein component
MLKKSHRLSTKQFLEVMGKGKVHHSSLFLIRVFGTEDDVRIAAVAPKKVAPTAALRNVIRRRIYEATQPLIRSIILGTHVIIFAKAEATRADFKDMASDLKSLFSKAKISV